MNKLSETTISHAYSSELTLFQIIPQDFHSTLFFKSFHSFLRATKEDQKAVNERVKAALFMLFHIEGNSKWAMKFNKQLVKCHEKIESNVRSNFECDIMMEVDSEEEVKQKESPLSHSGCSSASTASSQQEQLEQQFINVAEKIERDYDFEQEIMIKKEMKK